ncbi:MAG: hypothetical protein KAS98_14020, partial [Deltaproteobacteria bacterium]|nr:hypothetical protein [Deltaproteobacteria bacterium]
GLPIVWMRRLSKTPFKDSSKLRINIFILKHGDLQEVKKAPSSSYPCTFCTNDPVLSFLSDPGKLDSINLKDAL